MRLGLDVRYLSHGLFGGVHTYLQYVLPALLEAGSDHQFFLYADTKRPFELADLSSNATLRLLPWKNPGSSVYFDLALRRQMARDQLQIAHFPANHGFGPKGARTIVTLHDEINIMPLYETLVREIGRGHVKSWRTAATTLYLHALSTAAARRSDLIMTVSQFSARQIARWLPRNHAPIEVMYHAPTPDLRRIEDAAVLAEVRSRNGLKKSFLLADGLKNPAVLVRAWRQLPAGLREGRAIVFFARRPEVLPIVHEAVQCGEAQLLIRPSREDLIALYSMADAFVFPSWIEGFGIPILEAMVCGAPVIASDRGSIPEVSGNAALLADAEDAAGFAGHIRTILEQPDRAAELRQLGYVRAGQFSWKHTAERIIRAYEQVWAA